MPSDPDKLTNFQVSSLLALTWAAGALDALCYTRTDVFAANMTGNLVLLGIGFARHENESAMRFATALLAFAAGVVLAGHILNRVQPGRLLRAGMLLELPFLVLFSLFSDSGSTAERFALIIAGSVGMAVQSVAVRRLKIEGVVTTFVTGTITAAVLELWANGVGRTNKAFLLLSMLLAYIGAAAVTAALDPSPVASWIPVACAASAFILASLDQP